MVTILEGSTPAPCHTVGSAEPLHQCGELQAPRPAFVTRYAKPAAYYRAEIVIAATVLWLRSDPQDTA
jgi:hypothetical protein